MKDKIEIVVNGKVVASHEQIVEGDSPLQRIERGRRFSVAFGGEGLIIEAEFVIGKKCLEVGPIEEKKGTVVIPIEKKVIPIEPMVIPVETPTPVQKQMEAISTHHEIPIKTRKPRSPNKAKEAPEKSVFDKEDIVEHAEEIEKKGEFVPLEEAAKELKLPMGVKKIDTPIASTIVSPTPITSVGGSSFSTPTPTTPTTPARINELAKLIKMWCKAAQYKIEDVTIKVLNDHGAYDIIENDSEETVEMAIKEAARAMKG